MWLLGTVMFFPAHPASFAHNFVSRVQSFYAMVLQTCHEKKCSGLISLQLGLIGMGNRRVPGPISPKL